MNLIRRSLRLLPGLWFVAGITWAADTAGPIRVHPDNPRYFLWNGRATVLVASGEHYGSVINPDFDFRKYLDTTQAAGLNHTRVFLGDYVESGGAFGIADNTLAPASGRFLAPWLRSNTPGFAAGGNRFDLDRWDPAYFERLHAFFEEAQRRGIVVEAVFFFAGPTLANAPLNASNNINGTSAIDAKHYLSLNNGNVLARQETYCRRLVRELNRYDNVIFNLCNEPWFDNQEKPGFASQPPAEVKAWIRRVSEWVASEESKLPKKHLMSVDLTNQGSKISAGDMEKYFHNLAAFNVHYDANADILRDNPNLKKVLAFNETGFNGTGGDFYRTQGWRFLLAGGGLYGNLDFSFTVGHEDGTAAPRFLSQTYDGGGSAALRAQLKILLDFMQSLPLEKMQPDNSIVVGGADTWNVLASKGQAYAIWFPGHGAVEPLLNLPPGDWKYEWVDILTGSVKVEVTSHKSWVVKVRGDRRGGGAALRITKAEAGSAPVQITDVRESGPSSPRFDEIVDAGLKAMSERAAELHIGGAAVLAYFEGDSIQSWSSKMTVVGRMKDTPSQSNKGANLLAIAYAKASEMADTLKASGSGVRPPMTGEFGWQGGLIVKTNAGYWIAAFSGGKSEDDVEVSRAGLNVVTRGQ